MSHLSASSSGWYLDLPDHRDFSSEHDKVRALLRPLKLRKRRDSSLPKRVDWREYCLAIEDQQGLATSAAHAAVGMIQYFERRSSGRAIRPSRLFVHSTSRRLLQTTEQSASIRASLKAITRFGIPPEAYWPYDAGKVDQEPDAFAYGFSDSFRDSCYVRLDGRRMQADQALDRVRAFLAAGFVCVFGFPVCSTITDAAEIPFPTLLDETLSGHAVVAVGYDDSIRIRSDKGAFLIRNSWGPTWGDEGYGWLPFAYLNEGLAADFWTVLKPDWLASVEFKRPF